MTDESRVYIGLGSNLGSDPAGNILAAIKRLHPLSLGPWRRSSLWESAPVDCPSGSPWFTNAVMEIIPEKRLAPEQLLARLLSLEGEFGRPRCRARNAPRSLDLDLIAFGNKMSSTADLILPHPRAHQRGFVLAPLAELAPGYILPGQRESVSQLLAKLVGAQETRRREDP